MTKTILILAIVAAFVAGMLVSAPQVFAPGQGQGDTLVSGAIDQLTAAVEGIPAIAGPQGEQGIQGEQGPQGADAPPDNDSDPTNDLQPSSPGLVFTISGVIDLSDNNSEFVDISCDGLFVTGITFSNNGNNELEIGATCGPANLEPSAP